MVRGLGKNVDDWRSTGRRRARRTLYRARRPYSCESCGLTVTIPPKDAPTYFDEIWPEEDRVLNSQLQANHKTKELTDNSEESIEWLCPSCHKIKDSQTEKGISTEEVPDYYG